MDDLRVLRIFARIVETGSFSKTSQDLRMTQATVSKQIAELERNLKTKLLSRTTRSLSVTEAGAKFYAKSKAILDQYDSAIGEVQNLRETPSGIVRLGSTVMIGREFIAPTLKRFNDLFPEIIVEHYASDSVSDLVKHGIDVTIRVGDGLKDSSYKAKRLLTLKRVTVASKGFLKKYGTPKRPEDLANMPCILIAGTENAHRWTFKSKNGEKSVVTVGGFYRSNSFDTLLAAAETDAGILRSTSLALEKGISSGNLVRVLEDYDNDTVSLYAVTPDSSFIPQKTRVLMDFLTREFKTNKQILRHL